MKLIELADHIQMVLKASSRNKDLEVHIPNKCGGMCSPTIAVKTACQGFDWTNGKYLIVPEKEMIEKKPLTDEQVIKFLKEVLYKKGSDGEMKQTYTIDPETSALVFTKTHPEGYKTVKIQRKGTKVVVTYEKIKTKTSQTPKTSRKIKSPSPQSVKPSPLEKFYQHLHNTHKLLRKTKRSWHPVNHLQKIS